MADAIVKARLVVVLVATGIAATTAADVSAAAIVIVAIAQVAAMAIETATAEALDSAARWGRVAAQEPHAVRAALESVLLEDAAGRNELKPYSGEWAFMAARLGPLVSGGPAEAQASTVRP